MLVSSTLNSPAVKGIGKVALGIAVAGTMYSLDQTTLGVVGHDTVGQVIRYSAYLAGLMLAVRGASCVLVGE